MVRDLGSRTATCCFPRCAAVSRHGGHLQLVADLPDRPPVVLSGLAATEPRESRARRGRPHRGRRCLSFPPRPAIDATPRAGFLMAARLRPVNGKTLLRKLRRAQALRSFARGGAPTTSGIGDPSLYVRAWPRCGGYPDGNPAGDCRRSSGSDDRRVQPALKAAPRRPPINRRRSAAPA
jgi:hypothetical protein